MCRGFVMSNLDITPHPSLYNITSFRHFSVFCHFVTPYFTSSSSRSVFMRDIDFFCYNMPMGYVYILTTKNNKMLYIGVTNNLKRRVYEHKQGLVKGFTKQFNIKKLVYYEQFSTIVLAIQREKVLKEWNRSWKNYLINKFNPEWKDLYNEICF